MKMLGYQLSLLGIFLLVNYISAAQECKSFKVQPTWTFSYRNLFPERKEPNWMVAISIKNDEGVSICSGFLIDRRHVLTVAHCFHPLEDLPIVRVLHVDRNQGTEYAVQRIAMHGGYKPGYCYDDIALLTLASSVGDDDFSPICLPWSREFMNVAGMRATAVGWEVTRLGDLSLKQVDDINVISNFQCNQAFMSATRNFLRHFPKGINSEIICGDGNFRMGFSGGPLVVKNGDQWLAVGILSFGNYYRRLGGCTRISEYLDWIGININDV